LASRSFRRCISDLEVAMLVLHESFGNAIMLENAPARSSGVGSITLVACPSAFSSAVRSECGSPAGVSKHSVLRTEGVFGTTSLTAFEKISSVLQNSAAHSESLRMYVQSFGS